MGDVATNTSSSMPATRGYQQEMLEESLQRNIIIALDTGSGKTLIAVLRIKHELERETSKVCWFFAPTVALCEQQKSVIQMYLPVSIGLISGALEPDQWKNAALWARVLATHRVIVSTPQVFLDALRHGYISMGNDICFLVFDEAHHAVDNHPYNKIMQEFYFDLPPRNTTIGNLHRPMILGLTASPIFGSGDIEKAFRKIEANLDCTIRSPRYHRAELSQFVHRPTFKHAPYTATNIENPPFSTNLASLEAIIETLNIEHDPYVISLRKQFAKSAPNSAEWKRLDQKLSKVILKKDSFTHKGLKDFARAANDICIDMGTWAADWFVWKVVEKAKLAANPFNNMMSNWKSREKVYLLSILDRVVLSPVSYYEDDIMEDTSDKIQVLVNSLLEEKSEAESFDEAYSGLIFVQRRDSVLALAELLSNHPFTKDSFNIGILLGTSDNSLRHSMMDITRNLAKESQAQTMADFKIGEKNLIISTSVAEEGIDIQACGSVIRWDPPPNMASWVQSRGRARRQRSTFTLMYDVVSDITQHNVEKWRKLEEQMMGLYTDPLRLLNDSPNEDDLDEEDNDVQLISGITGAYITPHSAVSHLSHFCAVISRGGNAANRPLYDIDPPDLPQGWHSLDPRPGVSDIYLGPWGSKVTLPRSLPIPIREFETERIYNNKISAHRHAAFKAYKALYDQDLLNNHLLPFTDNKDPELESEVKAMLADVEQRSGLANVSLQMNPWVPEDSSNDMWYTSELSLDGLPTLILFTRCEMISVPHGDGPTFYRPNVPPVTMRLQPTHSVPRNNLEIISKAREYTRMIFWCLNGSRLDWDNLDFAYLVLPKNHSTSSVWDTRRTWLQSTRADGEPRHDLEFTVDGESFLERFGLVEDLTIIRKNLQFGRAYQFIGWRHEPLTPEEEDALRETYSKHRENLEIVYPLLVVRPYPPRTNFLIPIITEEKTTIRAKDEHKPMFFVPQLSGIALFSAEDAEYSFLLPSVFRWLSMTMTVASLREMCFGPTPLNVVPISLLTIAMTAPVTGEQKNYQRLETLGDTVLKFTVGLQLFAAYPTWHEGYLTRRKDHAVSNARLAKENMIRHFYRWIIRDRMVGRKWMPRYLTEENKSNEKGKGEPAVAISEDEGVEKRKRKKKKQNGKELSTKVLADVIEALIGAAYIHGGFELGYESVKFFDLGLKWEKPQARLEQVLSRFKDDEDLQIPPQIQDVEYMIGYTFQRKTLLIEALTHASYQEHIDTISYERLEFLGDSILDMVVTDYLYHAPGKNYSPGHMHLRKSALVNGHFLAFICLRLHRKYDSTMPRVSEENGRIVLGIESHDIYLWKCLLHSSPSVLEDQYNAFTRFKKRQAEIEEALQNSTIFPWAALTRLQAPKFFSDIVESIIGAVYLDSHGNMDTIKVVLRNMGILQVLERVVNDDIDVLHPASRLSLWASKNDRTVEYQYEKSKGEITCIILINGVEEVRETELYRGSPSKEEVKFAAAEKAIHVFKLRDVGTNYALLKKKTKQKKNSVKKYPTTQSEL